MSRRDKIAEHVHKMGGSVGATVRGADQNFKIVIELDHDGEPQYISHDGVAHHCPSALIEHLEQFVSLNADGSNTAGGNAANNVLGNYDIYGHIITDGGLSLSDIVGKDNVAEYAATRKARPSKLKVMNMPANTHMVAATKNPNVFIDLAKTFGRDQVIHDRKMLTVNEFSLRYGVALS